MKTLLPVTFLVPPLLALAACGPTTPPPAPPPPPPPMAQPAPAASIDWRTWAVSAGDWRYRAEAGGSVAEFGPAGAPLLSLRCDSAGRRIILSLTITPMASDTVRVHTSFGSSTLPVQTISFANGAPLASIALDGRNSILDQLAFSRGRFALVVAGQPPLVAPNWAEVSRVIEDCRS